MKLAACHHRIYYWIDCSVCWDDYYQRWQYALNFKSIETKVERSILAKNFQYLQQKKKRKRFCVIWFGENLLWKIRNVELKMSYRLFQSKQTKKKTHNKIHFYSWDKYKSTLRPMSDGILVYPTTRQLKLYESRLHKTCLYCFEFALPLQSFILFLVLL